MDEILTHLEKGLEQRIEEMKQGMTRHLLLAGCSSLQTEAFKKAFQLFWARCSAAVKEFVAKSLEAIRQASLRCASEMGPYTSDGKHGAVSAFVKPLLEHTMRNAGYTPTIQRGGGKAPKPELDDNARKAHKKNSRGKMAALKNDVRQAVAKTELFDHVRSTYYNTAKRNMRKMYNDLTQQLQTESRTLGAQIKAIEAGQPEVVRTEAEKEQIAHLRGLMQDWQEQISQVRSLLIDNGLNLQSQSLGSGENEPEGIGHSETSLEDQFDSNSNGPDISGFVHEEAVHDDNGNEDNIKQEGISPDTAFGYATNSEV
ncbi:hypothetical protein P153DRAFT_356830 [Dothidotthia symphoricarpi CBS 119687]|uniref:Uncharacterized protein n=1 Tax=Dothidotthia symphoricarpi CBS 119687 TaxID=1392245 RepID=A0A6A6AD80_9PLEO|nr:uncharacterized protein P153DRAFT_356830 [Dothidotthia symphoricarpi CBS 119687]KAF2129223.1 hypothetical protein P153DRAFT_356830 [Dothidotthia symphoricarpi CBS 119687]